MVRHIHIDEIDPLVSIIVPAYNAEKYIGATLDSLCKQMLKDIEIIVVNDGSTDKTAEICKHFFFDRRIKYLEKENGGTGSALNFGHSQARGKFATWCSADNVYFPDFAIVLSSVLQKCIAMESAKPVEFVYSDFCYIDANGKKINGADVIHKSAQPSHDLVNGYDLGMSFMYTMDLWKKTGLYWENICEDYHWAVRAAQHTEFALVNRMLAAFRVHGNQITGSNKNEEQAAANACKKLASEMLAAGRYGGRPIEEQVAGQFKPTLVEG